jgi:protein-tyrosine phosphatase
MGEYDMFGHNDVEELIVKPISDPNKNRLLSFSGAKNFRDLGGYQTADGRTVRWERLYRSDSLHKLNAADIRRLSALNIHRVIDFRSQEESQREPDRLPREWSDRLLEIPILDSTTKATQESRREFLKNLKNIDPLQYMHQMNVELATKFTPEMKQFVGEILAANGRPVLFHCAAGKDRTGFAAAILLRALGVPQDVVLHDYQLTNQYLQKGYAMALTMMRLVKGKAFSVAIGKFMEAHPEYLGSGFESIDLQYGSFDGYLSEGLGLTKHDIESLAALYLE